MNNEISEEELEQKLKDFLNDKSNDTNTEDEVEYKPFEYKNTKKPTLKPKTEALVVVKGYKSVYKVNDIDNENVYLQDIYDNENTIVVTEEEVYPIFEISEEPKIGDFLKIQGNFYLITKVDASKCLYYTHIDGMIVDSKTSTFKVYSHRKIKKEVLELEDGYVVDGVFVKELENNLNVSYKFRKKDYNQEIFNISKKYNLKPEDVKGKEKAILTELKITLDHPLNIEKSRWALLVGEPGTGKTTIAREYAKAKGIKDILFQGNAQVTVDDFKGYKSITTGEYFRSLLREAVEHGYIFIIDEIDSCNPNTLVALHSLKNEHYQFEDAKIKIHPDFRLIATANTLEYSEEYNARMPMDKATLQRFKVIEYDMKEMDLCIRYGLKYIEEVSKNHKLSELTAREVDNLVTDIKVMEDLNSDKGWQVW